MSPRSFETECCAECLGPFAGRRRFGGGFKPRVLMLPDDIAPERMYCSCLCAWKQHCRIAAAYPEEGDALSFDELMRISPQAADAPADPAEVERRPENQKWGGRSASEKLARSRRIRREAALAALPPEERQAQLLLEISDQQRQLIEQQHSDSARREQLAKAFAFAYIWNSNQR